MICCISHDSVMEPFFFYEPSMRLITNTSTSLKTSPLSADISILFHKTAFYHFKHPSFMIFWKQVSKRWISWFRSLATNVTRYDTLWLFCAEICQLSSLRSSSWWQSHRFESKNRRFSVLNPRWLLQRVVQELEYWMDIIFTY